MQWLWAVFDSFHCLLWRTAAKHQIVDKCQLFHILPHCRQQCLPGSSMNMVTLISWSCQAQSVCQSYAIRMMFSYVSARLVLIPLMSWWLVSDHLVFCGFCSSVCCKIHKFCAVTLCPVLGNKAVVKVFLFSLFSCCILHCSPCIGKPTLCLCQLCGPSIPHRYLRYVT